VFQLFGISGILIYDQRAKENDGEKRSKWNFLSKYMPKWNLGTRRIMKNLPRKQSNFLLYTSQTSNINIDVVLFDESVWLTQKAMGELFSVAKSTISEHMKNIYESEELTKESTVRKIRTVQKKIHLVPFWNILP